jgi:hypothetical protein
MFLSEYCATVFDRVAQGDLTTIDEEMGTLMCKYTTDIATGLAAGAFLFLFVAQMFIMSVTRCLCCGRGYKPGASRTFAFILFIFSWFETQLLFTWCHQTASARYGFIPVVNINHR